VLSVLKGLSQSLSRTKLGMLSFGVLPRSEWVSFTLGYGYSSGYGLVGMVVLGGWLDSMILEVFSNI